MNHPYMAINGNASIQHSDSGNEVHKCGRCPSGIIVPFQRSQNRWNTNDTVHLIHFVLNGLALTSWESQYDLQLASSCVIYECEYFIPFLQGSDTARQYHLPVSDDS